METAIMGFRGLGFRVGLGLRLPQQGLGFRGVCIEFWKFPEVGHGGFLLGSMQEQVRGTPLFLKQCRHSTQKPEPQT